MSAQDSKATVQRIVEEIFNNKKLALIDEYVASDVIDHSAPLAYRRASKAIV